MDGATIRKVLLEVISELDSEQRRPMQSGALQQSPVLERASQRLGNDRSKEQALLTAWHDLFRTGHLAWGLNLMNPNPPFCHLTEQGRQTLAHLSRDPANPDGYRAHLRPAKLNAIAEAYVNEAVDAYNTNCFRAAVVMVGAASESLVIELRDVMIAAMKAAQRTPPRDLADFRIKRVLDALQRELQMSQTDMAGDLAEDVGGYWPAFTQQIRSARNEAGHPVSVAAVGPERAHAALLVFPEIATMAKKLRAWIPTKRW